LGLKQSRGWSFGIRKFKSFDSVIVFMLSNVGLIWPVFYSLESFRNNLYTDGSGVGLGHVAVMVWTEDFWR